LHDVTRESHADEFWNLRGHAIDAYAKLEHALARLFATVIGGKPRIAGAIFFRIVNTNSRNSIIEDILKIHLGSKFALFRNSLIRFLSRLDKERNKIVHWEVTKILETKPQMHVALTLEPRSLTYGFGKRESITADSLADFIAQCDFVSNLVEMFDQVILGGRPYLIKISEDDRDAMLDIFLQPIEYPPPTTHPLSPIPPKPDDPP